MDTGIDTLHEDLKAVLWTGKNGIHGWNYIGAETGREDVTNLVGNNKSFYDSLSYTVVPEIYKAGYKDYRKIVPQLKGKIAAMKEFIIQLEETRRVVDGMVAKIGNNNPSLDDFKKLQPAEIENKIRQAIIDRLPYYKDFRDMQYNEIDRLIELAEFHLEHGLNIKNEEADTANDDADISPDKIGILSSPNYTPFHGSHVAGIIAAVRNNGIGMDGVANNVQLMTLKANGNIRELRDKSLAEDNSVCSGKRCNDYQPEFR